MEKREPTEKLNDPGPKKRTNGNQDAAGTTDYIQINLGNQGRMQQQATQSNHQENSSDQKIQRDFEIIQTDKVIPKKQFILSYEEIRKMEKNYHMIHKPTGIKFYFPYQKLHLPQKKFIANVYEALNKRMNAIIESSTGTGKTLSLLASCLSWLEHCQRINYNRTGESFPMIQNIKEANYSHILYSSKSHSQLGQIQKELLKLPYRPKMVIYGSREKLCNNFIVQWKHGIKEDKSDEMKCRCDAATHYMREFKNKQNKVFSQALQGSKRTIYIMVSKCFDELNRKANTAELKEEFKYLKRVTELYLLESKSKITQIYKKEIIQIYDKLKFIEERKKHESSLSSRSENDEQARLTIQMDKEYAEQMKKINKQVVKEMKDNRADIYYTNQMIKLCIQTKNSLKENQIQELKIDTRYLWSMESRCRFYKKKQQSHDAEFFDFLNPKQNRTPLTIETIKKKAIEFAIQTKHSVCTYFHPKRVDGQGELYLMPYNYLLDQNLLPLVKRLVKNAILIFDEGHNVDKSAREGYSVTFDSNLRKEGLKQINQNRKKPKKDQEMKNADELQIERLEQQAFKYQNLNKKSMADEVYNELRKQDELRQKRIYLQDKKKEKKSFQRMESQNEQGNQQNNQNNNGGQDQQMPNFKSDLKDQQLYNGLINWILDIMKVIGQNVDKFFSEDRKSRGDFDEAINSGSNSFGWRDHAWKHTADKQEIKKWIKKAIFYQNRPFIEDSTEQQFRQLKVLDKIIKKFDQIIDLKFAKNKYNFKIKALRRFFVKLHSILFDPSYKGKYYLFMKQQIKWSTSTNRNIYIGQIQLKCLSPQFAFQALQDLGPRSIIITSGTLSPMERFEESLGLKNSLPFVKAGSVIKKENLHVRKIGCDLNSTKLWISYKYFFKKDFFIKNAINTFNLLIELIERIPNGVLIMLSSYSLSQKLKQFFDSDYAGQIRARFLKAKPFVQFQKKKTNAEKLIDKYNYFAQKDPGAVLFCVSRAKLTQGIDFKDKLCRGVIVLGVPLLSDDLPQVIQMKQYLNIVKQDENYNDWMLLQVAKAINQGLGRVVRDQNDYGSIYLIDSRFNKNSYGDQKKIRQNISDWIQNSWDDIYTVKQLQNEFKELLNFFAKKKDAKKSEKDDKNQDVQNQRRQHQNRNDQGQSLRPTYNQSILQKFKANYQPRKLVIRQSVRRDLDKNRERLLKKQVEIIYSQLDPDYQKAVYESYRENSEAKQVTQKLDEMLKEKGLTPKRIKGDGNCLYRSVRYLQSQSLDEDDYDFVKDAVIQVLDRQLEGPPYLVDRILNSRSVQGNGADQKIRNYRDKISRRNQYGTQIQIQTICYIFGVSFIIHRITHEQKYYYPNPDLPITPDSVYHIGYYEFSNQNFNHYFAIVPTQLSLSQYNTLNYSREIEQLNEKQKNYVEPEIINNNRLMKRQSQIKVENQTPMTPMTPQTPDISMVDENHKQPTSQKKPKESIPNKKDDIVIQPFSTTGVPIITDKLDPKIIPIDYKSLQTPITASDRKNYSQKNTITYSQTGTILNLNNFSRRFNIQEFLANSWKNLQILQIENCHITNQQWRRFVESSHLFPNLRYVSIGQNQITHVRQGDLQNFAHLRVIYFKKLENPTEDTIKYLSSLKEKYRNSEDKSKLILPLFRK